MPKSTRPPESPARGATSLAGPHRAGRGDEAGAVAGLQPARPARRGHQGDERVVRRPVVARQFAPARPRARAARRGVGVVGEPHRPEAGLPEGAGQIIRSDRVLGREHHDAVIHVGPPRFAGLYYPVRRPAMPAPRHVIVCGAGVVGASVAYFLTRRGVAVTVVERTAVACAASGKSGGFLALDWCDGTPVEPPPLAHSGP